MGVFSSFMKRQEYILMKTKVFSGVSRGLGDPIECNPHFPQLYYAVDLLKAFDWLSLKAQ